MGYRKLEGADIPSGYKATTPNEPYPITIFNEEKPISDNKICKYIGDEFNYYLNIYENIKTFGLPQKDWTQAPHWLLEMCKMIKSIENEYESYQIQKQYK